jgi:lysyl-tRNA synthetase class 2
MSWTPTARPGALAARAELLEQIRAFFAARDVLEVETPVLSGAGNSDPGIHQWRTRDPKTWLRTSPEYAMKRLLAAGSGDIYELGRVFRADESGRNHNREFTLLEWYRVGWSYHELMGEVAQLLRHCLPDRALVEQRFSYRELFQSHTNLDPFSDSSADLGACLAAHGTHLPNGSRGEYLDLLLSLVIQPRLDSNGLTFVYDFPAEQAALARIRPGDPPVAERFEMFLGPVELANGYQELTDAEEQARRFRRENEIRAERGQAPVPVDHHLLDALQHGLPECSGVALGVDRLLMYATGAASLDEVIAFFGDRA